MERIKLELYQTTLSIRALKILSKLEVITAHDLITFDVRYLRGERNCGDGTVLEVTKLQTKLRHIDEQIKSVMK